MHFEMRLISEAGTPSPTAFRDELHLVVQSLASPRNEEIPLPSRSIEMEIELTRHQLHCT
jgi:hypothetical protein